MGLAMSSKHLRFKTYFQVLKSRCYRAWIAQKRDSIGVGRATAAIFGACFLSLTINMALSVFLPLATNDRLTVAMMLAIPIWVCLAFYCLLLRNALVAWTMTAVGGTIILLMTLVFGIYG